MAGGAFIPGVKTSAFVGPAGTGKSQRAQLVASLVNADFIIDDGLVIHKGSIVCGKSAKSERNQISAIRRALFEFDDHRREVVEFHKRPPCLQSPGSDFTSKHLVFQIALQ